MAALFNSIPLRKVGSGSGNKIGAKSAGGISVAKKAGGLSVVKRNVVVKPSPLESMEGLAEFLGQEDAVRMTDIEALIQTVVMSPTSEARDFAVGDLASICLRLGLACVESEAILAFMNEDIQFNSSSKSPKDGGSGGLLVLIALLKKLERNMEPFALLLLPKLLTLHSDKSLAVRELSAHCADSLMKIICPFAFRVLLPHLIRGMVTEDWKVKVGALRCLKLVSSRVSEQLTPFLPMLIPITTECILDSKMEVKQEAISALSSACAVITNDDIRPIVPQLVSVIARPEESAKTIDLLLETTFVQTVDSATLALIAPLLGKLLRGRSSALKRKAARVIDSMCRLVQEPQCVAPFVPMLLPYLDRAIDEVVDFEVVDVCKAAKEVIVQALGDWKAEGETETTGAGAKGGLAKSHSSADALATGALVASAIRGDGPSGQVPGLEFAASQRGLKLCLLDVVHEQSSGNASFDSKTKICEYISKICAQLIVYHTSPNPVAAAGGELWRLGVSMTSASEWKDCVVPYVQAFFPTDGSASEEKEGKEGSENKDNSSKELLEFLAAAFRTAALGGLEDQQTKFDEDDANLCNIDFSLAFGGKILLHTTQLRLGKGRRYGLMGKNGAGKTTLLTNIGNGAIEGMPLDLKTVYVQHDDASDDHGIAIIDELLNQEDMKAADVTREQAVEALQAILFTDDMIASPRSALSGGWKMKLLIIKAMLAKADILLLDEPTNHLDKASVKWLENYIKSVKDLTCLIVSHDTQFLDNTITDVIHYEQKKLVYYHGNLTAFVDIHPEARYYYELDKSELSFKFPVPEKLDGINSSTRAVMTCKGVTFTYPGCEKPTLNDVSVKVCLGSRVGVLGANGAGKSTLIKLLVQETEPDLGQGEIWKHMNLRVAYVAQHSFTHVENHMDKSPVDYMKWRFGGGVDKESLSRPNASNTEEEQEVIDDNQKYGAVTECISRRKNGKNLEYECTFFGQTYRDPNKYFNLEHMIQMGYKKLVEQMDIKVAAMAAGLDMRPILTAEIQGHLDDFCLEAEYGTHGSIRRLSGGQKVKLVLAAAMWNRPHLLVLDEPTNYLDREALGALTQAIKNFAGGVLIISHNAEFVNALCSEKWEIEGGVCTITGAAEEGKVKSQDQKTKMKKVRSSEGLSKTAMSVEGNEHKGAGCTNQSMADYKLVMNPKKLEPLTAKEQKKLGRLAAVAGKSIEDYVKTINSSSPEWKWL